MSLAETLIAGAMAMSVTGAVFSVQNPAHGVFQAQPEAADMQQRMRVAVDTLTRDILAAALVLPYRAGASNPDPPASRFDDRITLVFPAAPGVTAMTRTYYLKADRAANLFQLMQYDGDRSDFPVVDHVVALEFEHFGEPISRVRVTVRVEAAPSSLRGPAGVAFINAGTSTSSERFLPDREITFDVTPRNVPIP